MKPISDEILEILADEFVNLQKMNLTQYIAQELRKGRFSIEQEENE